MYEWAQLLRGVAPPDQLDQLESGHWYRVETRRHDGFVRVLGPNAFLLRTRDSLVRIIDHEPNTVTRVQATSLGVLSYYGVCPKWHRIEPLGHHDSIVKCDRCGMTYDIEDEEVGVQPDVEGQGNETTGD